MNKMLELKVLDVESGDLEDNIILVDIITGKDNDDCERKASEKYYDTDKYAWSYSAEITKKTHGGTRPGAGRPPTDRKTRSLRANDAEWELILKYADKVRK